MRLDHLLSKEHHETQGAAHRLWGFGVLGDSVDGPCAVVAAVRVHDKHVLSAGWAGGDHQTHYWALRQQAFQLFALFVGEPELVTLTFLGGLGFVSAPSWWWGVVFDLWIVVASIS